MTLSGAEPDSGLLERMGDSLAHRGPDGDGAFIAPGFGFVHRRLAIIDLETGEQPLTHQSDSCLVANGEIYNYLELMEELGVENFRTRSDCEVPLHLYAREGEEYASRLRGMYAIALYDKSDRRLLLSRDPFGIKPLYYCEGPFGFAFASEPRAFFDAGLTEARLRRDAAPELFQLQFTTGAETAFAGVFRVLPGETLVIEAGRIVRRHLVPALPEGGPLEVDEDEALRDVETALRDSVLVHQRSDVPFGMFLSGGVDSSALLVQMARLNETPVRAYTVGFPDTRAADEREHARQVASALGADHIEVEFTEEDFWQVAPRVAEAMDDPVADYAELPTYKLAEVAARDVKVILCGEGGDEMFAGYGRYRSVMRPWRFLRRAMRSRGALSGLGLLREENRDWRGGMVRAAEAAARPGRSPLQIAQATDCADWLAHDLLVKLDRCLMAHGVEGRTPMLDPAIARAVFRLPDDIKVRGKSGKWILRRWLEEALPVADPFSRKRGFTVPAGEWITRRGAELGPLVSRQDSVAGFCHPDVVEKVFIKGGKRSGFAAWILLFFALWHKRHIERRPIDGNVFDALASD